MAIRAIFFDVAHTLLDKPTVLPGMHAVLKEHGIDVPLETLCARHAMLMEAFDFPDLTDQAFYRGFNAAVVRSLGAVPTPGLLDALFSSSTYQPWTAYADVGALASIPLPKGVLSNWDMSLEDKLAGVPGVDFRWILGSAASKVRKPDEAFFKLVLSATGLKAPEIAYVGDSMKLDIEPSSRLGFHAILIDRQGLYPHASVQRVRSLSALEGIL
jgi:FMN phosphatase YigB (HAD superfamily)